MLIKISWYFVCINLHILFYVSVDCNYYTKTCLLSRLQKMRWMINRFEGLFRPIPLSSNFLISSLLVMLFDKILYALMQNLKCIILHCCKVIIFSMIIIVDEMKQQAGIYVWITSRELPARISLTRGSLYWGWNPGQDLPFNMKINIDFISRIRYFLIF